MNDILKFDKETNTTLAMCKGKLHEEFNPKFKKVEDEQIICLKLSEMKKLQEKEFNEKALERARDVFLFCCFTFLTTKNTKYTKIINCLTIHCVLCEYPL